MPRAEPRGRILDRSTSIALTGDSFLTRRLTAGTEPAYLRLLDVLRSASTAFTNLEVLLHDFESPPMLPGGGTHARGAPDLAHDLAWAGFDLVSLANNHAGDFGVGGARATVRHVTAAGLVHAGVGESLGEAREARFLETATARVALIAAATTFPPHAAAADPRAGVLGRPGISPLRTETEITLTEATYRELAEVADRAGITRPHRGLGLQPPVVGEALRLAGSVVRPGATTSVRQRFASDDVTAVLGTARDAAEQADLVLVSLHTHEGGDDITQPSDHLRDLCHELAAAGASAVVCHGPHRLRGVELIGSCAIFYSLGNFIFQNETVQRLPAESYRTMGLGADARVSDFLDARTAGGTAGFPASSAYWETVIALPRWEGGELLEVVVHPVTLGFGASRVQRGRPLLAEGADAERIISELARLSEPYGTTTAAQGGTWRLTAA